MVKNNKGVTLVELLIVIVVMGIIAAFSIPAVGTIIENSQKDAILNDAIQVENAAKLYCSSATGSNSCTSTQALKWSDIKAYVDGLDEAYYDLGTAGDAVVATKTSAGWTVYLEMKGTSGTSTPAWNWEFTKDAIPSASSRDQVKLDED